MESLIIVGADIAPRMSNQEFFSNGDVDSLIGEELLEILKSAKYRIFNLECPFTKEQKPIKKQGPNLIAKPETIAGCKAMGIDLVTLANNHILDQDVQGLDSTKKVLEEAGIAYVGAGATLDEAAKPYVFEIDGRRFGLYACAEHEFSTASNTKPGANPYDPLESFDHVAKLKIQCDYVIVLYHGGKEHYRYPSPNLQSVCHKFVDKGADLIICQQSHCIGCAEKYSHGTIVYGQGNFLFDFEDNEFSQSGLLISIASDLSLSYIPVEKKQNVVRLATRDRKEKIMQEFEKRNRDIQNKEFIEKEYQAYADSMLCQYLYAMSPKWFCTRVMNRLLGRRFMNWYMNRRYKEMILLATSNYIECEAHRELILQGINGKMK